MGKGQLNNGEMKMNATQPAGKQAPTTEGHSSALAKKAEAARGTSKMNEVLSATGAMGSAISIEV